jgi:hypothetical protein
LVDTTEFKTLIRYYQISNARPHEADGLIAVERFEQTDEAIAALADQIARRLASLLRPQLSRLAASTDPAPARELWSARRVAAHYGVGVSFVYQHADELGCVRLGGGRRPRLRFDPGILDERWHFVGDAVPTMARTRRRTRSETSQERREDPPSYELIEYDEP